MEGRGIGRPEHEMRDAGCSVELNHADLRSASVTQSKDTSAWRQPTRLSNLSTDLEPAFASGGGRSFDCGRGLAPLRMTAPGEVSRVTRKSQPATFPLQTRWDYPLLEGVSFFVCSMTRCLPGQRGNHFSRRAVSQKENGLAGSGRTAQRRQEHFTGSSPTANLVSANSKGKGTRVQEQRLGTAPGL